MTNDYNAKLLEDYTEIKRRVERGMLPLVARNPALDRATSEYALAQAEHYHIEQAKGKNPSIPLRDSGLLHKCADLVMFEELKWSHPDKMSIVEYPIMSDRQTEERKGKQLPKADLKFGDLRYLGKRKVGLSDEDRTAVHKRRVVNRTDSALEHINISIDVQRALENANLTDRQRQAINLVYFENMTYEEAGEEMGVSKQAVKRYEKFAVEKLRKVFG